jgi:hypothetical protein
MAPLEQFAWNPIWEELKQEQWPTLILVVIFLLGAIAQRFRVAIRPYASTLAVGVWVYCSITELHLTAGTHLISGPSLLVVFACSALAYVAVLFLHAAFELASNRDANLRSRSARPMQLLLILAPAAVFADFALVLGILSLFSRGG